MGAGDLSKALTGLPLTTQELSDMGMIPGGLYRNRDFRKGNVVFEADTGQCERDILFDPQTSGGLLIAVPEGKAPQLLEELHKGG